MHRSAARHHARAQRHRRIRATVRGTAACPRLAVFRSLKHISAQLIDDQGRRTLAGATDLQLPTAAGAKSERAAAVGKLLAEKASKLKIHRIVFDRGGYRFHGRVKALAEAARQAGLTF